MSVADQRFFMVFYAVIFNISYLIKIKYIVDCLSSQNLAYQENLDIFWLGEGSNIVGEEICKGKRMRMRNNIAMCIASINGYSKESQKFETVSWSEHPLHKRGGMKFFKNDCNEGDEKFFLEMAGIQEWEGQFYNGRDGKFLKSLYIVTKRVLTPLFYEIPLPYCLSHTPQHPPPTSLSPSPPIPTVLSVVLIFWLNR